MAVAIPAATEPPKLMTSSREGTGRNLAHPFPERLEQAASKAALAKHRKLIDRADEARQRAVELRRQLERVGREDSERAAAAVLAGEEAPPALRPKLEGELEQAELLVRALRPVIAESAVELLAGAWAKVPEVLDQLREDEDAAAETVRDTLVALHSALLEFGSLGAQRAWITSAQVAAIEGRSVTPFAGSTGDRELGNARRLIDDAIVRLLERNATRRADVDRHVQAVAEMQPKLAEERRQRELEAARRRVTLSGPGIVEREPTPSPE